MLELIDINIIKLGIGLMILMATNIILGSIEALFIQTFDIKKFLQGLIKALVVIICFIATYFVGIINPDVIAVSVNGEMINVMTGMNLVVMAGFVFYTKEVLLKLATFIKGNINIGEGL